MVRKEMPNKVQACKVTLMKVPHFGKYKVVENKQSYFVQPHEGRQSFLSK